MKLKLMMILLVSMVSAWSHAQPTVCALAMQSNPVIGEVSTLESLAHQRAGQMSFFPVSTQVLTLTKSDTLDLYYRSIAHPIFLVGSDSISLDWVSTHQKHLKSLGAIGWIVDSESQALMKPLTQQLPNTPFITASFDEMANVLDVHHYPSLILPLEMKEVA